MLANRVLSGKIFFRQSLINHCHRVVRSLSASVKKRPRFKEICITFR